MLVELLTQILVALLFASQLFSLVKSMSFPLNKRDFVIKQVWKKNGDDSFSVATISTEGNQDYGGNMGKLRGTSKAVFTATNIEGIGGVKQCRTEMYLYIDVGGYVPAWVMNKKIPQGLGSTNSMARSFNRDDEIDRAALNSLVSKMKNIPQSFSHEDMNVINKAQKFVDDNNKSQDFVKVMSPDKMVQMKLVHIEGENIAIGMATSVVDASVEICAASEYTDISSR